MNTFFRDAFERTAATFVEGFAGGLILGGVLDTSTLEAAALGGVMAALAVVKSTAASFIGSRRSASLDPALDVVPADPAPLA